MFNFMPILIIFFTICIHADEKSELVQSQVKEILNATYKNEPDTIVKYTLPKIVELMGGAMKTRARLAQTLASFQKLEMKIDTLTFPEEPKFVTTDNYEYAVIPTLTIISSKGQKFESLNFQIGVRSTNSARWYYIEGSRVNKKSIPLFIPEFPTDYELPKFYRKKVL